MGHIEENMKEVGVSPFVVLYGDTSVNTYDELAPETRSKWIQRAMRFSESQYVSGRLGHVEDSCFHLLEHTTKPRKSVFNNSGYKSLCGKQPAQMKIRSVEHSDISKAKICKKCMRIKKNLIGAHISVRQWRADAGGRR